MRKFVFIISFIACCSFEAAAYDTLVIKDFSNEWLYFNSGDGNYQPLVERQKFKGNTLHFKIGRSGSGDDYLQITSDQEVSIFNGKRLVDVIKADTLMMSLLNLEPNSEGQYPVTLYAKNIDPETIQAQIVRLVNIDDTPLSSVAISYKRVKSAFSEFMVFSILVLIVVAAVLYNYFPRVFLEYLRVSRAFSVRETEENLLKSRPLSLTNLYFYIFFSLLCGLIFLSLFHLAELQLPGFNRVYVNSLGYGLWLWIKISAVILVLLIAKLLLVYNVGKLFQLGGFSSNHFFNYIRILLITLLVSIVILIFNFFTLSVVSPYSYQTFLVTLLIVFGLSVIMIYLKLMSVSGLKNLHLFSYLCTTELVPYGVILSVGISQAI